MLLCFYFSSSKGKTTIFDLIFELVKELCIRSLKLGYSVINTTQYIVRKGGGGDNEVRQLQQAQAESMSRLAFNQGVKISNSLTQ